MAVIRRDDEGRSAVLIGRTLVGRGSYCVVRVQDRYASQEHAVFWYDQDTWWLRDLDSRNGTYLNGERLQPHTSVKVEVGARVAFGNPRHEWQLVDEGAPGPMAENLLSGELVSGDESLLLLPSDEQPDVAVYGDDQGGWLAELDGDVQPVADQVRLEVAGQPFRLLLPHEPAQTWEARDAVSQQSWSLAFRVSSDEEYIECDVSRMGKVVSLKPRAHTFVLLTLARQRLEDVEVAPSEQGWLYVDDLCRMLRTDRRTLNVHVFRARKQIAATGLGSPAELVERRASTDQLRIGVSDVTVDRLA